MERQICDIASVGQLPYFRGKKFADIVIEVSEGMKSVFKTQYEPLVLTSSGTGLMEMAIVNLLNAGDKVVVINGGSFGKKWGDMCKAFNVVVKELKVDLGKNPDMNELEDLIKPGIKAVLVNAHETSTGYLYDVRQIGQLTNKKDVMLIVDAVSSIGADEFRMDDWHVDCALVSTQKALALMPGLGFIVFSQRAKEIFKTVNQPRFYFDAMDYLDNIPRGMTPFTPAMNIILQARERIKEIKDKGVDAFVKKHAKLAKTFRETITNSWDLGFFPERQSNSLTAIKLPDYAPMSKLVAYMRDNFDWWFAPNPTKCENYLRVSHMGDFDKETMQKVAEKIVLVANSFMKGDV
jgi:aspartate aminotransferase-like enzyme